MGSPGPIPWTAVELYASRHGFANELFDDLLLIVRRMDDVFIRHLADKASRDRPPKNAKPQ